MARDGSGNYALPAGQPVVTSTTISSSVHNVFAADVAAALTASIAKDGQTTPTADLPMGTFKHTGVGDGTARTQYPSIGQIQDADVTTVGSIAGTADAITGSLSPAITSYVTNMMLVFVPTANNTGAATIAINGLAAKAIVKFASTALVAGDLALDVPALILYDGTSFLLLNPQVRIDADAVANSQLANMAQATVKGRASGAGTGDPTDLSGAQVATIIGYTAADVLTKLLTVDGAGSGLDADLLDGSSSAAFAAASHNHAAADTTSGTFANARISEASVTQHEAALAINASQVTSDFSNNNSSFSVASSMAGDVREVDSGSAVTITVGSNCLGGTGKAALFVRRGAGTVTFSASGTTLRTKAGLAIANQHGAAALIQLSTTEYQLIGDL